ncbi:MAG: 3-oxoacyl-ACP synthase [Ignavibacteriae bacterium]|nr:3-oxoacyl-ACP synthase [Ignavibacteriota bacterium]
MNIKENLYNQCSVFVENRLQSIQNTITEIQESLLSEIKSSAGDKHETGRAMLQLEREKSGQQLAEIQKLQETLSKIDITNTSKNVCLGSIVYTTQANYFISISAGKISIDNTDLFAISPTTPIGQLLLSKQVGDEVIFRGNKFMVKDIL